MTSHHPSAHPMLEPLDYQMTPKIAAATLEGDLLQVYQLLWSAAVASAMDGPALRQQLLEIRLQPAANLPESVRPLALQAAQEVCIDPGWRELLPGEGTLGKDRFTPFLYPFPANLDHALQALPAGQKGKDGARLYSAEACAGLKTLLSNVSQWQVSRINLTPGLGMDQLLDQMAARAVGRPSTFAGSLQRAIRNDLIVAKGDRLEVGELGRRILDDIALHSEVDTLGAAYSSDLDLALMTVESDPSLAGSVLNEFSLRALGQSVPLADWLDDLMIEGESFTQALARAEARLPSVNSWDAVNLPSGLAPPLLTRQPEAASALREEIDGLLAQADHLQWRRFSSRQRAACRTVVLQLCEAHSAEQWQTQVCRDIAWRYWVDLGPEEMPFDTEDLQAARQFIQVLPDEIRTRLMHQADTAQTLI
ncbi:hypothetical protein [Pseudomonas nunensis]|uniref:hypothetical protein n=1 Tax=Pseudomonas nunensis TaxID=2961896 RepID=UPI0006B50F24|nr:hypothetical protein [Pseudomonas nunensis]KOY02363.1 hypothetical protein AM274_05890 [Pseudomonas nunensis]